MRTLVRRTIVICCAVALIAATGPDDLLQRGRDNYRSARYAEAVNDLRSAADGFLTPEQMQAYVNSGRFDSLANFEIAVIYLAMSYVKSGREPEARDQIKRLMVAEGIAPTYAALPLTSELVEFEEVARRIAPDVPLPVNTALASLRGGPLPALPPVQVAQAPVDEAKVASARAAAQQEAQQRIATEHANIERWTQERIAADRAAILKAADEVIAAERLAAERKIAEARAAAEREAQDRIAAARAGAQREMEAFRSVASTLGRADALANAGRLEEARSEYLRLLNAPDAAREAVAAAAVGLYRTGDYSDALRALQKLGIFARGEEDLRFYKAVALYETGRYDEAKRELACAVPYIQPTDEVSRYRAKIEQSQR